MFVKYRS